MVGYPRWRRSHRATLVGHSHRRDLTGLWQPCRSAYGTSHLDPITHGYAHSHPLAYKYNPDAVTHTFNLANCHWFTYSHADLDPITNV